MSDNTAVPVGTILAFGGVADNLPGDYLLCNGAKLKISNYKDLHAAIGFSWGGDPEDGTFYLPDLRGIFVRGADIDSGHDPDSGSRFLQGDSWQTQTGVGSWQRGDVENHEHQWDHFFQNITNSGNDIAVAQQKSSQHLQSNLGPITRRDGGSPGHETRPINAAVTYIIYAGSSSAG